MYAHHRIYIATLRLPVPYTAHANAARSELLMDCLRPFLKPSPIFETELSLPRIEAEILIDGIVFAIILVGFNSGRFWFQKWSGDSASIPVNVTIT
jgi:hypothetical protein